MAETRRFVPEPQVSRSWTQCLVDQSCPRRGAYHIPVLRADEEKEKVSYLETSVPEDTGSPVPLKPQKPGYRQNLESRLLQLPPELLLRTMLFMPCSSLYMIRQTCQVLRNLTDFQFPWFHSDILQHNNGACYISRSNCDKLRNIKRIFLRGSLCGPCGKLFDSGELEKRLGKLWKRILCIGCMTEHPELLFPQRDREENVCVALQGKFALCKHLEVSGKVKGQNGHEVHIDCSHPEHVPLKMMNSSEREAFKKYRPRVENTGGFLHYSRSFALVKIDPAQYPGMPALKARLLEQLKEIHHDGLCQHVSTQLDAIVASLPSDKCRCFPSSGVPVYQPPMRTTKPRRWCDNHGYDCRYCGARYFWFYDNNYIVLRVWMDLAVKDRYNMGWLGNITFDTDENPIHPIFNESTKGILWCDDPSCGTGWGNRWLLMVEIMKRANVRDPSLPIYDGTIKRDRSFLANMPFRLEYQVFQNAAGSMVWPSMLSLDLLLPTVLEPDYTRTGLQRD